MATHKHVNLMLTNCIIDNLDPTKQLRLDLTGITTDSTKTLIVPNTDTQIVGTETTDTLKNKNIQ